MKGAQGLGPGPGVSSRACYHLTMRPPMQLLVDYQRNIHEHKTPFLNGSDIGSNYAVHLGRFPVLENFHIFIYNDWEICH